MSDVAIEIFWGAVLGFIAPWWIRYAFASAAIKKAGLRLTMTFDTMFLTVPFFAIGSPLWLNGRLPTALEQFGLPTPVAIAISMPLVLIIPFVAYRLAAFLPGVVANREAFAAVEPSVNTEWGRKVAGLPAKKLEA